MRILLLGGSGFIGSALRRRWLSMGHSVTLLRHQERQKTSGSAAQEKKDLPQNVTFQNLGSAEPFDIVVNLAGAPIVDRPWTQSRRRLLYASRIDYTGQLLQALEPMAQKPRLLLNASAIGYYGNQGTEPIDECFEPNPAQVGKDFAHQLCREWERSARQARNLGMRVCLLRLGLVLGEGGGIAQRMALPFRLGVGGPLGDGQQWMSWVHRGDVLAAIDFLIEHAELEGVFNLTAPQAVTHEQFCRQLARQLGRPCWFRVPAKLLRLVIGDMASLLLEGQNVLPTRLQAAGYHFQYETLDKALAEIFP